MKVTGIILAGGESSRMNFIDKGLIDISDKPCIQHVIDNLKSSVDHIIIISNNDLYSRFGYKVYSDFFLKKGPMGGIYTGLKKTETDLNLFVACDMPLVTSDVFDELIKAGKSSDVIVPQINDHLQPLCAIYNKKILPKVEKAINEDKLKLRYLIHETDSKLLKSVSFKDSHFFNMNTPKELKYAKEFAS